MKNVIYLLVVTILFSSCASNSFLTQRYTNFRHSKKEQDKNQQIAINEKPASMPEATIENDGAVSCSALSAPRYDIVYHPKAVAMRSGNSGVLYKAETIKDLKTKTANHISKIQKTANEKSKAARGAIGTVLKIVLFVVILAIVLGVVILVALL